ncbi:MAG TPA: tyrosine-type recombinase/integrase [Chlamydiales bacterium]|nr:tyrosine-type recombinase/integrase [Chlamydiales bacterium]
MATIQKRKNQNGTDSYRVMIRPNDGLPTTYKTFPTFQEAKDWSIQEEARRRQGIYFPEQLKKRHTLSELIDRYLELMSSEKIKSAEDILRHLNWWKGKIGKFTLNHITPDLIAKYRKELTEGKTSQGKLRTSATANRYLASLSGVLSYGVKECGWISVNPMLRVSKLKEAWGRDRILSKEECEKLLAACSQSKSPFLLTIVVLAISTGMRQGEILGLTWNLVNLDQGLISLKETKSGHPRSIPLVGASLDGCVEKFLYA